MGGSASLVAATKGFHAKVPQSKEKEAKVLYKKVAEEAKKQGVKIKDINNFDNAAYLGSPEAKLYRKFITRNLKKLPKEERAKKLKDVGSLSRNLGKDVIGIDPGLKRYDILAHELGHAQYYGKGRSKSLLGKSAHRLYVASSNLTTYPVLSLVNGFRSGVTSEKRRQKGEKDTTLNKASAVGVPLASSAPMLISEAKASLNGLSRLKRLGASKELLKHSRKTLGSAFSTYATMAGISAAAGYGARKFGQAYQRVREEDDKKLSKSDRKNLVNLRIRGDKYNNAVREAYETGSSKKLNKQALKHGVIGIPGPALVGGIAGLIGSNLSKGRVSAKTGGLVGAGIGAAIPVGKTIARVIKNSKKSPRDRERLSDLSKVAENKMTRDQFSNKWYNK